MRRTAAGHDHSTQHLTDVRTRRVYASSGDGYAAIGWDYPGSTLLEVRILRSEREFAPAADGRAPEAGGGAAAAAGQTVVYHDVSGSFRDAGLLFDGTPGLLLASRPFGRLDRYLPASYGMF